MIEAQYPPIVKSTPRSPSATGGPEQFTSTFGFRRRLASLGGSFTIYPFLVGVLVGGAMGAVAGVLAAALVVVVLVVLLITDRFDVERGRFRRTSTFGLLRYNFEVTRMAVTVKDEQSMWVRTRKLELSDGSRSVGLWLTSGKSGSWYDGSRVIEMVRRLEIGGARIDPEVHSALDQAFNEGGSTT